MLHQDINIFQHPTLVGRKRIRSADASAFVITVVKIRLHQRTVVGSFVAHGAPRRCRQWINSWVRREGSEDIVNIAAFTDGIESTSNGHPIIDRNIDERFDCGAHVTVFSVGHGDICARRECIHLRLIGNESDGPRLGTRPKQGALWSG